VFCDFAQGESFGTWLDCPFPSAPIHVQRLTWVTLIQLLYGQCVFVTSSCKSTFLISTSDMSSSGFPMVNDRNLSLPQPRINSRLVIFRLKSASDAWVVQVLWSRSDQLRHLSRHLDQKHWTLSRHPSQAVNPRQHLGPYLLADRDFRHLKRHDPTMVNHLRSDLDQLGQ